MRISSRSRRRKSTDHALYPASGAWGVISSDESHVLVGGSEQFITDLFAASHGPGTR